MNVHIHLSQNRIMTKPDRQRQPAMPTLILLAATLLLMLGLSPQRPAAAANAPATAVIVQASDLDAAMAAVASVGGAVTHELGVINAVGALLSPAQQARLQAASAGADAAIRLYDNRSLSMAVDGLETVRDTFSQRSYANNDGSQSWAGSWQEIGDDGKVDKGKVKVDKDMLRLEDKSRGIQRTADLTTAVSASLSFVYQREKFSDAGAFVVLEISADGGATWAELDRFTGPANEKFPTPASYDVSGYAGGAVTIRFMTSPDMSGKMWLDNVEIAYEEAPPPPPPPPLVPLASGISARDEFNLNAWNNNDGIQAWLGAWTEIGESDGTNAGDVGLVYLESNRRLKLWEDIASDANWFPEHGLWRAVDLSGATSAQVSLLVRYGSMEVEDYLSVDASTDGGDTWSEVGRISGPTPPEGSWELVTFDLSDHISADTAVRILTHFHHHNYANPSFDDWYDSMYLDNVQVTHDGGDGAAANSSHPTLVGVDQLHALGITGGGSRIAVIDSGYWSHAAMNTTPDYQPRIRIQYDAITNQVVPSYTSDDTYGHGAHVNSIIFNKDRRDDTGFYGIAPGASLVSVKAFDGQGMGNYLDVIRAIDWVVQNKDTHYIDVLNLSFSATPQSAYWDDPLNQAVMRAWQAGIVVVAAAGNGGPAPMSVGVPGNVPYVVTVGAMSDNYTPDNATDDVLTSFSAAGPTVEGFVKPDVVAPGGHILGLMAATSQLAVEHPGYHGYGDYFMMSGTSQATAVTSGVVALMLQVNPTLTPDDVKCRLMAAARPAQDEAGALAYSIFQQGAGVINAADAVFSAADGCANQGLDIAQDLAGTQHFQGKADRDANGNYYVVDESGFVWSGGFAWSGGFVWSGGYTWSSGFAWSGGFVWSGGFAWSGSVNWDENPAWSASPAAVNVWVPQE